MIYKYIIFKYILSIEILGNLYRLPLIYKKLTISNSFPFYKAKKVFFKNSENFGKIWIRPENLIILKNQSTDSRCRDFSHSKVMNTTILTDYNESRLNLPDYFRERTNSYFRPEILIFFFFIVSILFTRRYQHTRYFFLYSGEQYGRWSEWIH